MVRFTNESLQQLRSRIDLAEVLSQHIDLKRSGSSMKALCPFHEEKSPSFVVNRGDSHYHCFGCGAHGDAIQFLMTHLRVPFADAVQQLADRFQVSLEQVESRASDAKTVNKARLKEAVGAASRFYQTYLLHTDEGKAPLSYLFSRGLPLDFIRSFQVGLSPKFEGPFRKYMHMLHFSDEELQEAGLIADRSGRMRDFFSERLMFPILDAHGATIGFSARKFHETTFGGKYINTPETPLFKKSRTLFGLAASRRRIIKQKQAIVVEGGLDALRMIFNGFDLTIAALGTAFGEEHVHEVCQLGVTRVFLLFDGDEAGFVAAIKVGHLFQKRGVEVLVATFEQGQDPDSLLAIHGPIAIAKSLVQAKDYLAFLVSHYSKSFNMDSPAEKNKMVKEIVQRIREWDNAVMVHESLKKLATLAEVPQEILGIDAVEPRTLFFKRSLGAQSSQAVDPDRILEQDLLRWLILSGQSDSDVAKLCEKNIMPDDFRYPLAKILYEKIMQLFAEKKEVDLLGLAADIPDEELGKVLSEILNKKVNRDRAHEQTVETIRRIKERNWMHERELIKMKIHSGKASDDELMLLVKQFDDIKKKSPEIHL